MGEKFLAFVKNKESALMLAELGEKYSLGKEDIIKGDIVTATNYLAKTPKAPEYLIVELSSKSHEASFAELDKLAAVCAPATQVILLGEIDELSFYKKIIEMGIAEYILNPANAAQIEKIINAAPVEKKSEGAKADAKIISVVGTRGGVGASSIALNLASILAANKHKTAILDLDPEFGTIPLLLDIEPSRGLVDALEKPDRVDSLFLDRAMTKVNENLFVLGAERAIGEVGRIHADALEVIINLLKTKFAYIIVDVSQVQEHEHFALKHSSCLLVTELSIPGLRDTMRINDLIKEQLGNKDIKIIANKFGLNKKFETPQKDFEQGLGRKIDFVIPFDGEAYGFYDNGKVMASSHPETKFAKSVAQIASSISSAKSSSEQKSKKSLLDALLKK